MMTMLLVISYYFRDSFYQYLKVKLVPDTCMDKCRILDLI